MKKFILLISMMLCVNQIKSWSFTDAALGVVSSARGFAGSHSVIACTGLGLWVAMAGFMAYSPAKQLLGKYKAEKQRARGEVSEDFYWNGEYVCFNGEGKLALPPSQDSPSSTPFNSALYKARGSLSEADHLSSGAHYYTLVSSGAIAALSLYGIYKTVFC